MRKAADKLEAAGTKLDEIGGSEYADIVQRAPPGASTPSRPTALPAQHAEPHLQGVQLLLTRQEKAAKGAPRRQKRIPAADDRRPPPELPANRPPGRRINTAAKAAVAKLSQIDEQTLGVLKDAAEGNSFAAVLKPIDAMLDERRNCPP